MMIVVLADYWRNFLHDPYSVVVSFFFATLVQGIAGFPLYRRCWYALSMYRINSELCAAASSAVLYCVSFVALLYGMFPDTQTALYCIMASLVLPICALVDDYLYQKIVQRTRIVMHQLDALLATLPHVFPEERTIFISKGNVIPYDGLILHGGSFIDEYVVTKARVPVWKSVGRKVFAGTTNKGDALHIQVTAVGTSTVLGSILERMHKVQGDQRFLEQHFVFFYEYGVLMFLVGALFVFFALLSQGPAIYFWQALWSFSTALVVGGYLFKKNLFSLPLLMGAQKITDAGITLPGMDAFKKFSCATSVRMDRSLFCVGALQCNAVSFLPSIVDQDGHGFVVSAVVSLASVAHGALARALKIRFGLLVPSLYNVCSFAQDGDAFKGVVEGHTVMVSLDTVIVQEQFFCETIQRWQQEESLIFYCTVDGVLVALFRLVQPYIPAMNLVIRDLKKLQIKPLVGACDDAQASGGTVICRPVCGQNASFVLMKDPEFLADDPRTIALKSDPMQITTLMRIARSACRKGYQNCAIMTAGGALVLVISVGSRGLYCGPLLVSVSMLILYLMVLKRESADAKRGTTV